MLAFPARLGQAGPAGQGRHTATSTRTGALRAMHRRGFLKAATVDGLAAVSGLAAPRGSLAAQAKVKAPFPVTGT